MPPHSNWRVASASSRRDGRAKPASGRVSIMICCSSAYYVGIGGGRNRAAKWASRDGVKRADKRTRIGTAPSCSVERRQGARTAVAIGGDIRQRRFRHLHHFFRET